MTSREISAKIKRNSLRTVEKKQHQARTRLLYSKHVQVLQEVKKLMFKRSQKEKRKKEQPTSKRTNKHSNGRIVSIVWYLAFVHHFN